MGFKRDDPSTWDAAHMPVHYPQGLFVYYGVTHEAFVWKARQFVIHAQVVSAGADQVGGVPREAKVLEAFREVWGTDELICSFDAMCVIS